MFKIVAFVSLFSTALFAVPIPPNWGDFQMGLLNNGRPLWDEAMKDAQNVSGNPYKLDRRYMYIADTTDMKSFWGKDNGATKNWSKEQYYVDKGVRPASVIYMVQKGGDSWPTVEVGMKDSVFMHEYFRYIGVMADSSRGQKPIYVIEPDVWTYMLQKARENDPDRYSVTKDDWSLIKDNNFDKFCHINDLGYPWLAEFENKASNLPGAIIKTLKLHDPECYAGILLGFWGFQPSNTTELGLFKNSSETVAISARETGKFAKALLASTPYKGDFCGLEKNGTDLGYWKTLKSALGEELDWDDRSNGDWVKFAKTISDSTKLPLIGWQIALGHPGMADTLSAYSDTFFPYFWTHTKEFIDAGFIGMLAGASNQDRGTLPTVPGLTKTYDNGTYGKQVKGDEGWWFSQYKLFNEKRPWVAKQDTLYTVIGTVVPDSVFTAGAVTDPLWDNTKQYGDPEHGKTYAYNGRKYLFSGYWGTVGSAPDKDVSNWSDLGVYGTWAVVVGGTVDNSSVFYKTGSNVEHQFKPVAISGYGIGSIKVNGKAIAPTDRIVIPAIDKDYKVEVKFVKGGTVVSASALATKQKPRFVLNKSGVTLNQPGSVELYSVSGRKILGRLVSEGETVSFEGIASGTYIAHILSAGTITSAKVAIR